MESAAPYPGLELGGGPTQYYNIAAAKSALSCEPYSMGFILMLLSGSSSFNATCIL